MVIGPKVIDSDFLEEQCIRWALKYFQSQKYTLKSNLPENVQKTPWSYVVRFETSSGFIYLKHVPQLLALEPIIIHALHDQFQAAVPEVIAHHTKLNCFLMKDAGSPLRKVMKHQFNAELFCKAIDQFKSMQLAVADHINVFLDIGVPDWRLNKIPDLYMQLLSQKEILITDDLLEKEIDELVALFPKVKYLCQKLSDYSIKPSIVQPDFNDNNTLLNEISREITIIDLGEVVISHPSFSLINFLRQIKKHYALTDNDDAYLKIMDACFESYKIYDSEEHPLGFFSILSILELIYRALSYYRLMSACDKTKLGAFYNNGRVSGPLKELIAACDAIDNGNII